MENGRASKKILRAAKLAIINKTILAVIRQEVRLQAAHMASPPEGQNYKSLGIKIL